MPTITLARLEARVREVSLGAPDFRYHEEDETFNDDYPDCHYTPDEKHPLGCLMGQALLQEGAEIADLLALDEDNEGIGAVFAPYGRTWGSTVLVGPEPMLTRDPNTRAQPDRRTLRWLVEVQRAQDKGESWGHAVEVADDQIAYLDRQHDRLMASERLAMCACWRCLQIGH